MLYAKSTGGFYDPAINPVIPTDAVTITPAQYTALFAGQAAGQIITADANGNPVNAAPPPPTLAQQAAAMMAAGLTITSTGTPALNGVYACDGQTTDHIQAEMLSVVVAGTFADGTTSVNWPDIGGTLHSFPSPAAFQAFALAVSAFVAALFKVENGTNSNLPSATAVIP